MEYSRFFYTSITYKSTPDPAIFHIPIIGKTRCDEVQNQMRLLEG